MNTLAQIPQGASFARTYQSVLDETGAAVTDFTGWTFGGAIKTNIADADNAAVVTIADGSFVRASDKVGFTLSPATMSVLTAFTFYYFAVKARSPAGFVDTIDELVLQVTETARQSL